MIHDFRPGSENVSDLRVGPRELGNKSKLNVSGFFTTVNAGFTHMFIDARAPTIETPER